VHTQTYPHPHTLAHTHIHTHTHTHAHTHTPYLICGEEIVKQSRGCSSEVFARYWGTGWGYIGGKGGDI